jgi:DNA-binding GntR family transcriptional regulator
VKNSPDIARKAHEIALSLMFEKSYNTSMDHLLVSYLAQDLTFKIVRGLLSGGVPRHLRDLARAYAASPAGVADVINRLKDAGVVIETRQGNRRLISLKMSERERESLASLFAVYECQRVRTRARRINRHPDRIANKLKDMDEMYEFYRIAKRRHQ